MEEELKKLLQDVGDAIADVAEQVSVGTWVDDRGQLVRNNKEMQTLVLRLEQIGHFRHKHLNYSEFKVIS